MEMDKRAGNMGSGRCVELTVIGPPRILRKPFKGMARLDSTWEEFFAECGMRMAAEDGVYVRTLNSGKFNTDGELRCWTAELNEPIGEFVSQYEGSKKKHTVKLILKNATGGSSQISTRVQDNRSRRRVTPKSRQPKVMTGQGGGGKGFQRGIKVPSVAAVRNDGSNFTEAPSRQEERMEENSSNATNKRVGGGGASSDSEVNDLDEVGFQGYQPIGKMDLSHFVEIDFDSDDEEAMAACSVDGDPNGGAGLKEGVSCHRPEEQLEAGGVIEVDLEEELQRDENQAPDIKAFAAQRLGRFDKDLLQGVRNEIRKLRATNEWDRNVSRAPFACYLLQELFQN